MLLPLLMRTIIGISLLNFILTTYIYFLRYQNQPLYNEDSEATISRDVYRKFESAWFREKITSQTRDFYVESELLTRKGPNVPLLTFDKPTTPHNRSPPTWLDLFKTKTDTAAETNNRTDPSDVYFSVRTTGANHVTRIPVLLDTWVSSVSSYTRILTDTYDKLLQDNLKARFGRFAPRLITTDCPGESHSKWALFCKLYWEYQHYVMSGLKESWFCHFDDDAYVNIDQLLSLLWHFNPQQDVYIGRAPSKTRATVTLAYKVDLPMEPYNSEFKNEIKDEADLVSFHFALGGAGFCISKALAHKMIPVMEGPSIVRIAASITLPDDCVIGYVITHLLNVSLTNVMQMHSHIEDMTSYSMTDLSEQVTFSFALPEPKSGVNSKSGLSKGVSELSFKYSAVDGSAVRRLHNMLYGG